MATIRTHLFHRPEECDSFQPCFFDHEDVEFYGTRAPMTSDEIWDKFELLPTPPRSPNREPASDFPSSLLDNEAERLHLQPLISEDLIADLTEELLPALPKPLPFPESPPTSNSSCGLNSKLIQDCMWSGRTFQLTKSDACVENKTSEKTGLPASSVPRKAVQPDSSVGSGVDIHLTTDCVDPAVVFPYPINSARDFPDIDTPSDSGNEEEDEEIDVVNVEKIHSSQLPTHLPTKRKMITPVNRVAAERVLKTSVKQVASLLLPAVHACHTYSKQIPLGKDYPTSRSGTSSPVYGHTTSLKRTSGSVSLPSSPHCRRPRPISSKRPKRQLKLTTPVPFKKVVQKLKSCSSGRSMKTEYYSSSSSSSSCSSRLGSDSEGEGGGGKRTQHNVLERKRRNDLKYSFFQLRDAVPELSQQERAPKVVILRKATDFINDLNFKHRCLITDVEKQRARREHLRRTLKLLQP